MMSAASGQNYVSFRNELNNGNHATWQFILLIHKFFVLAWLIGHCSLFLGLSKLGAAEVSIEKS